MEHHKDNSSPAEWKVSSAERRSIPICTACRPFLPLSGRGRKGPKPALTGRETSCSKALEIYLYVEKHADASVMPALSQEISFFVKLWKEFQP